MALAIVRNQNFIEITGIAADLRPIDIFKDDFDHRIKRIELKGLAYDICVIKHDTDAGPTITTLSCAAALVDRVYFDKGGQFLKPMIDFSECTFAGAHKLIIELA